MATQYAIFKNKDSRMWFRHKHSWVRENAEFNPPVSDKVQSFNEETMKIRLFGFTNITYYCAAENCTEIRIQRVVGKIADTA